MKCFKFAQGTVVSILFCLVNSEVRFQLRKFSADRLPQWVTANLGRAFGAGGAGANGRFGNTTQSMAMTQYTVSRILRIN